ncbi:MAG: ligase-associated DNA damage response endonuclease PdeM [Fimbriimonas sp.]
MLVEPTVQIAGEELHLRRDKTAFWPRASTLFVADVHLGKAASFRAFGLPIPAGTTDDTLGALSRALEETGARRLAILGDLWHAKQGRTDDIIGKFLDWRRYHGAVEMTLIEGNHDRRSGRLPAGCDVDEVAEPYPQGPFALRHYPEAAEGGYVLSGHLHPAAVLSGRGRQDLRLPCFWFGPRVGVLPAFGDFTGCAPIRAAVGDRVFVVAENRVLCVA